MYRNYIFDFYGTLADIRTDEEDSRAWETLALLYGERGAVYLPGELRREFLRLERCETERLDREYAEPDLRNVFTRLYTEKGVECDVSRAKETACVFREATRRYLCVYDGVKELLEELGRRGRGVYLLSNAQADFTRPEIGMLGLTDYFDGIVLSSEQGVKKPSPVLFETLLETYGLNRRESIMIGNDRESDIEGARLAGLSSLYIHTDISPQPKGRVRADYCVMDGDFRKIGPLIVKG